MEHAPLIVTIVVGIGLAFVLGSAAALVRVPPLVGYLLAGIVAGPFTPGIVADSMLAAQLAEIGVILLMFGVGLHFSPKDLVAVAAIAIPGAVAQIAVATVMGLGLAIGLGWSVNAGLVFGLALSVASTVVLLRALQERREVDTRHGRIAMGWLIVEDLSMVLALVLLPSLASLSSAAATGPDAGLAMDLGLTLLKVAAFVAFMLVVGRRVIPWVLHVVAHMGSRELFRLAVLAIALGVAFGAAELFGVSLALGAFFAGMVLSESELSHQAAQETLPLRDAFAVLFFVSVGMLFDPAILWHDTLAFLATLFIILVGKSAAAFLIVRAFRHPARTALTISASLAQIGEFSFILAEQGIGLGLLPERARGLILGGAIVSILFNPLMFALADRLLRRAGVAARQDQDAKAAAPQSDAAVCPTVETSDWHDHVILAGYGRVGSLVGATLRAQGIAYVVVEDNDIAAEPARQDGAPVLVGNIAKAPILAAARPDTARCLVVAIPNGFEAGQAIQRARALNPALKIIARAHADALVDHLTGLGADVVVVGEREIARGISQHLVAIPATPGPATPGP